VKANKVVSGILLLFVVVAVSYLAIGEWRDRGAPADEPRGGATDPQGQVAQSAREGDYVIVYYFYGNKRCNTCRTIEAYAKEAVETGFTDLVGKGDIVWQAVNTEQEGNGHFVEDYELAYKTVVLVEVRDGEETKWEQLNKVWELVDNKQSFVEYVQQSTADFMGI